MENPVAEKMVTTTCAQCGNLIDVTGLEAGRRHHLSLLRATSSRSRASSAIFFSSASSAPAAWARFISGATSTLNRVVAVKVLKPELVSDQKFLATFLREAEITASLNHPNIVQVYAFGQHEGVYYMVVEYISGGSLDDKIAERGPDHRAGGNRDRHRGGARAGMRAAARRPDPSRHQAGQHSLQRQQHAQGGRFRPVAFL